MSPDCRWRTPAECELLWRSWDDEEFVVFHARSGDTHLLNAMAAEALEELGRRPVTAQELAVHLGECLERPADEELQRIAAGLIREFDELGLIEPVA